MTTYSVHRKSIAASEVVILVPDGFNLRAFLFTVLWALWHRLWILAAGIAVAVVAAATLPGQLGLSLEVAGLIQLAVTLLIGFEANDLRRLSLSRAGYDEAGLVSGASLVEAELRYFASRAKPVNQPPAAGESVPARYAHDTLGLFGNV